MKRRLKIIDREHPDGFRYIYPDCTADVSGRKRCSCCDKGIVGERYVRIVVGREVRYAHPNCYKDNLEFYD